MKRASIFVKSYEYYGARGSLARFVEELVPAVSELMPDIRFVYATPVPPRMLAGKDEHLSVGLHAGGSRASKLVRLAESEVRLRSETMRLVYRDVPALIWELTPWLTSLWGEDRTLTTVHDLLPLEYPTSRAYWLYYRYVVLPALRRKRHCVADSDRTKTLLNRRQVASVTTIACWVAREFSGRSLQCRFSSQSSLLFVGTLAPYKNLDALLGLYRKGHIVRRLRCVVPAGSSDELSNDLNRHKIGVNVQVLSNLDDIEVAELYASSFALIVPSLDEGFGLPAIEAMHHGVPVVASDTDIMREVCGDAALYFSPHDGNHLKGALETLEDEDVWLSLSEAGLRRAACYGLDRAATKYCDILERMLRACGHRIRQRES